MFKILYIAKSYSEYLCQFNSKFSASECESMWKNVLRPGINRNKWTAEEEEELKKLATKYKMKNWKQIAEELGVKLVIIEYRIIPESNQINGNKSKDINAYFLNFII